MTPDALALRLLGADRHQRLRFGLSAAALALLCVLAAAMGYLAWTGLASPRAATWWAVCTLGSSIVFLVVIRLGANLRLQDPSMVWAQTGAALVSGAWAYAIAGGGRGVVFPLPVVVLMIGMYSLDPRRVWRIAAFAMALFGATMAVMSLRHPQVYDSRIELAHFVVLGAMLIAVSMLAEQLGRLRLRLRTQKHELEIALGRIQDLSTRDELTGLPNRRHLQEMLTLEHQRGMRTGHTFCVAMIDIDRLKEVNDRHGRAAGDDVLRALAAQARQSLRAADVLGRWSDEEFLLLMSDMRAPLARTGVERLRESIGSLQPPGLAGAQAVTLSAGLAEHRAGEPLEQTLARADQALCMAKAQGRNRIVVG